MLLTLRVLFIRPFLPLSSVLLTLFGLLLARVQQVFSASTQHLPDLVQLFLCGVNSTVDNFPDGVEQGLSF